MNKFRLLILMALVLPGCAHIISDETRKGIDTSISFSQIKNNADAYIGKKILVGGKIIEVHNTNQGGQLEILQFTLDSTGFPIEISKSAGRFIATSPDFIDSAIYETGRLVTMAGEVKGKRIIPLDGADYIYPIIGIKEIFAWKMKDTEKGINSPTPTFYNNYNPYDFSHDVPLWYRPTGPAISR